MKIAYALTGYLPSTGGAQIHFHEIARRLQARHEVRVFCHWKENRTDWLRGVTVHAPGDSTYAVDGVPVTQLNLNPEDRARLAPWVWGYYLAMGWSVDKIAGVMSEKLDALLGPVDLIHAGRMGREFLAWAALRVARKRKIPFVLTPFHHPKWGGWRWRWYTKLYREADAVIALTQAEKNILAGLGVARERIHVIGHAPVLTAQSLIPDYFGPGGPVVLFLGQKYAYKGLAQLLAAMPLVWQQCPEARFAFLGPRTPYSEKIFQSISDVRVIEKDRVSDQEKMSALAGCAVFCLPSRQESFGSVYTEAWMQGKPVIGGNIPAVSELINHGTDGLLVGESPRELAQALLDLLQDTEKAKRLGQAGLKKVQKHYTWDAVIGAVEKVYTGIM
jgi:glycosyltransferase involved in cell wall biosynthesis